MLINISGSLFCGLWNILNIKFIAERKKYEDLNQSWHLKPIFLYYLWKYMMAILDADDEIVLWL
jgi:hypothetical protein